MMTIMNFGTGNARMMRVYLIGLIASAIALALDLWNGFARGHWQAWMIFTLAVLCPWMALQLRRQVRRPRG
jgi:uncharacterized membrane protein YhaH (DUF805 family)